MKITGHFTLDEFKCKDGTEVPEDFRGYTMALATCLERIRAEFNAPIQVISAYRTPEYNKRCGGSKNSQHLLGKAADIRISGITVADLASTVERLIEEGAIIQGGIGTYPKQNFVHYDIRGNRARWKG